MSVPTNQEMLDSVNTAINALLNSGAQSYTISGRTFQRPDLDKLWNLREKLEAAIAGGSGGARNFVSFSNPD